MNPARRRPGLILVLAVVLEGAIGAGVWAGFGIHIRPKVHGRTVEDWVAAVAHGDDTNAPVVLQRLESSHLPELCSLARRDATTIEWAAYRWQGHLPIPMRVLVPDPTFRRACADVALNTLARDPDWGGHSVEILRTALDAPPSPTRSDYDAHVRVFDSLDRRWRHNPDELARTLLTDPGLVTVLGSALTNQNPWIQYHAVHALDCIGPGASNAVPLLRTRYHSGGRTVAQHAAHAVWHLSGERREPLTILLASLGSWDKDVLTWTLRYLVEMAPESKRFLPEWQELAGDNLKSPGGVSFGLPARCGAGGPVVLGLLDRMQGCQDAELAEAAKEAAARIRQRRMARGTDP